MRIQYTYKSFPNCPKATEYSKDRQSTAAYLQTIVGALVFFSVVFFLFMGFSFFGNYEWGTFLLSVAWIVLDAIMIFGLGVCMPNNTECELKIILMQSSTSEPLSPEIISSFAKILRRNAREANLEEAKAFFPRFFLGLFSVISLIAAIKAVYFMCCGKDGIIMLICAIVSLVICGAIAFFSFGDGRDMISNKIQQEKSTSAPDVQNEYCFCRKCGAKIPGDSVFCPKCGVKVLHIPQETRYDNSAAPIERLDAPILTPKKGKNSFLSRMDTESKVIFFLLVTLIPMCIIFALVKGFMLEPASSISNPTDLSSTQETISSMDHVDLSHQSTNEGTRKPYGKPLSGTVSIGYDENYAGYDGPKLTIHASSKDCYVKLKDIERTTVCSFFVRANESVTIGVPRKTLYAYFAEGNDWYGWVDCFGEETIYSKDPQALSFMAYDYEYNMSDVGSGNLILRSITKDEF